MVSSFGSTDPCHDMRYLMKEISIGKMDFDNIKVYGDTSTSDGLVVYADTIKI